MTFPISLSNHQPRFWTLLRCEFFLGCGTNPVAPNHQTPPAPKPCGLIAEASAWGGSDVAWRDDARRFLTWASSGVQVSEFLGGWQCTYLLGEFFTPKLGEMIFSISFFKWVGKKPPTRFAFLRCLICLSQGAKSLKRWVILHSCRCEKKKQKNNLAKEDDTGHILCMRMMLFQQADVWQWLECILLCRFWWPDRQEFLTLSSSSITFELQDWWWWRWPWWRRRWRSSWWWRWWWRLWSRWWSDIGWFSRWWYIGDEMRRRWLWFR